MINEDLIKGKWTEIKGEIKTQWGKMTDNELDKMAGNLTSIAGLIQQRYGSKREEIQDKLHKIASKVTQITQDIKEDQRKNRR